ncbi:MAG: adenine deaminase [Clostridiales bacterium]|nr:adenine deaminase [Clostridiales bacterium]
MKDRINSALGYQKADIVLRNAKYVNVFTNELLDGDIAIKDGYFVGIGDYIGEREIDLSGKTVIPSFIDAHIHLESSIVSPYEFTKAVIPHGTTAVVADPHEIANVIGTDGIDYMLQSTAGLPLDVFIMLPSCVPAVDGEENGAVLTHHELVPYLREERVLGLGEVMNCPGVLNKDYELLEKIESTLAYGKKVDGHAPGVLGKELNAYITAGITSDHECTTLDEALEKLRKGMWIAIREGTAAKNVEALIKLFDEKYHFRCMTCTDDKHPGDILKQGHMDYIVKKAVSLGANPILAIKTATINTAKHFRIPDVGAIGIGYKANFSVVDDIRSLNILSVYKCGSEIYNSETGLVPFEHPKVDKKLMLRIKHTFNIKELVPADFEIEKQDEYKVIGLHNEQITTEKIVTSDVSDCTMLAVAERHKGTGHIGKCYLSGYGLKKGAIATSISHDNHNLIVAGKNAVDMAAAANCVRANNGGIAIALDGKVIGSLALPLAGLMCDSPIEEAAAEMDVLHSIAADLGVNSDIDPFMTLGFVSLTVIPAIRLTTKGIVEL